MRLRVSGTDTGDDYELQAVMDGAAETTGLPHGGLLNAFAEAICADDAEAAAAARQALVAALGPEAMIDAAAAIAAFNAYPRMADATGIPLEEGKAAATAQMRSELGLEVFNAASD